MPATNLSAWLSPLDALDIPAVVHDADTGAIRAVTRAAEKMYGYSEADLKQLAVGEFSAQDFTQADAQAKLQAAADGEPQVFEWEIQRGTGELLWLRVRLLGVTVAGEEYVAALPENITRYKIRERRLRLLQRFTRHNLRNQVQVIHGYTEQMKGAVEDDAARENLEYVQSAVDDLLDLTDTIKTLKAVTDEQPSNREPLNLADLVTNAVETYRVGYPDVDISTSCNEQLWVSADDGLRFALDEALQNTAEHNDQNQLRVAVSVYEDSKSGLACIAIEDNGTPIPDMEVAPVEVDYEPDAVAHGGGAGIWLMNAVVESLGGRFSIPRADETGNELVFSLPQTQPPDASSVP